MHGRLSNLLGLSVGFGELARAVILIVTLPTETLVFTLTVKVSFLVLNS
jgi:hypothetical protein